VPAIPLAVPLLWLAAFVVAYGALAAYRGQSEDADGSIKGLLLWLAAKIDAVRIPIPGHSTRVLGPIADAFVWVANAIENALAAVVAWFEAPVAQFLYLLAEVPAQTARSLVAFATHTAHKLAWIERTYVPRYVRAALLGATAPLTAVIAAVHMLRAHALPALWGAVARARAEAAAAVAAIRTKALYAYHAATVTLPRAIAADRAAIGRTAKQARAHARRLARLEALLGTAALTAAVAVALNRLGLRWLRCSSLNRIGRRVGCAPWRMLEDVFMGTFTVLVASDLCRWTALMTTAAEQARPLFLELVDVENALVGCHGNTAPAPLRARGYSPTPLADPTR
jgi:hypothetical protein